MSTDFEGPSLWHGREINSCVKCKWLKSHLVRSGKNPDYHFHCSHPVAISGGIRNPSNIALLVKVKAKYPDKLEYFKQSLEKQLIEVEKLGEFISNDSYGPETPGWCPIIKQKADEAGKE